jgi:aryl-alcohol dehydrogenase-like predicted oxidoreductase
MHRRGADIGRMDKRRIGSLSVSVVGLGCNNFGMRLDAASTAEVVDAAIDAGIDFFDTADVYGGTHSEEFLGRALGKRRNAIVLATKFGMPIDEQRRGARPEYIKRAVEDSLERLGTDRIDLYQLHRPDPEVPIADTLGTLDDLVRAGKVREIGSSNFSPAQIQEAERAVKPGAARFVSVQNEYSVLHREPERGVLEALAQHELALLPYFPLASGVLTGKYADGAPPNGRLSEPEGRLTSRFLTDKNVAIARELEKFARARGKTLLDLAFSWLLAHASVASVIAGATTREQITGNVAAARWQLSQDDLREIDRLAPL